jgi:DNA polymerase-1
MLDDWEHLPEKVDANYIVVEHLQHIPYKQPVALDTENDISGVLGQWSVAYRDSLGQLCVTPYYGNGQDMKKVSYDNLVIFHNAKWDLRILKRHGLKVPDKVFDTMIAAYCLGHGRLDVADSSNSSGDRMIGGLGLKYLARRHLGMEMETWEQIKDHPERVPEYNAKDSVSTYLLYERWKDQMPQHFWDIDMPLLPVIMAMEDRGIKIDPNFIQEYALTLDSELKKLDIPLNVHAPEQVRSYVYGTLGIEPWQFTATGAPSVEAEVLETIDDPLVDKILEYKHLYKEKGTYIDSYLHKVDLDGRIRGEFKQTRTATGRLSAANPNLQNVAKTDLRKLFIAEEGHKLIRADWKQIELRVFAALTGEERMIDALLKGRSIHQETADALGLSYDEGKTINFLMLFGGEAWSVSREFHVPIDDAKAVMRNYFTSFPGIKKYQEEQKAKAHEERRVYNYFGRLRRLDEMYTEDWRIKKKGEKEAINTPIQGTAGEIVKIAMIELHKKDAPMLLQVHDELLFEVDEKEAKDYAKWLEAYLPMLVEINGINFPVDIGIGGSWWETTQK